MSVATCAADEADPGLQPEHSCEWLQRLQQGMLRLTVAATTEHELLCGLASLLQSHDVPAAQRPFALAYQESGGDGNAEKPIHLDCGKGRTHDPQLSRQLASVCLAACRSGEIDIRRQIVPAQTVIAAPLLPHANRRAFAVAFAGEDAAVERVLLVQQLAVHVALWQATSRQRQDEAQDQDAAVTVDLLTHLASATDLQGACFDLAARLAHKLPCRRVVVGIRRSNGRCSVAAFSDVADFDRRSDVVQRIEAAMDETSGRQTACCWPNPPDSHSQQALTFNSLCTATSAAAAAGVPLRDATGRDVGAVISLCEDERDVAECVRFLSAAAPALAAALDALQQNEGSRLVRLSRVASRQWRSLRAKVALAVVLLTAAAMLVPVPYNVTCDCRVEPVTRRFAVAPFDGTLERSLVKPGDLVRAGDVLARMDGREIRFERAGVRAELQQALKKRDAAQASHSYADQRIAALEAERLELQLQLLDHRAENLEIKSPVDGIVVSGDLERAEGAPLTVGQTLFEIGPLDQMILEVAVPDADIGLVEAGQPVRVRLDAFPGDSWQLALSNLHPRSEIRDDRNVFVAEAAMENPAGRLRPGMQGRAKVQTPSRALAWILFHRPWEELTKRVSW